MTTSQLSASMSAKYLETRCSQVAISIGKWSSRQKRSIYYIGNFDFAKLSTSIEFGELAWWDIAVGDGGDWEIADGGGMIVVFNASWYGRWPVVLVAGKDKRGHRFEGWQLVNIQVGNSIKSVHHLDIQHIGYRWRVRLERAARCNQIKVKSEVST